jgi:D-arabinose 1-dehydrogenase-like Zn-dependent alcohol dehydrogenase
MAIPKEQKALVIKEGQTLKIDTIPVPKLSGNDILIKVGL